ncbi:hypothetical protein D0869_02313 [Hortaea werneckii]|uniref:Uncharacterized protein n=1 Tax=Hortaea werneckii TaxID=91943 RepID=A0A3M6XAJ1_HORWE|nr:hypothetical protein D0869_02313 [Hortaea werneckii]
MGTLGHESKSRVVVEIHTDSGADTRFLYRKGTGVVELVDTVELNDSGEAESKIQTGKWTWWQFEEDGEVINNMGLPIAILRYETGHHEVAIMRGVEVPEEGPSRRRRPTRVVCSLECWIIEVENIGSAVTEEETPGEKGDYGRVETRNSKGSKFSLDRYHISLNPDLSSPRLLLKPIYFITLETWNNFGNRTICVKSRLELVPGPPAPTSSPDDLGERRWDEAAERWLDSPAPNYGQGEDPLAQPDTEPGAEPSAGPSTDPNAEPNADPNTETEPEAEQNIEPGSKGDAPLTVAERGETQSRETTTVSASIFEAQSDGDNDDNHEDASDQPPRRQSKRLQHNVQEIELGVIPGQQTYFFKVRLRGLYKEFKKIRDADREA